MKNGLRRTGILSLLSFLILIQSPLFPQDKEQPKQPVVLENDFLQIVFDGVNGGVTRFFDKDGGIDHIQVRRERHLLWNLVLHYGSQENVVRNTNYPLTASRIEELPDGSRRAVLEWRELRHYREDAMLSVTVTVDLPKNSGIAQWRIDVDNRSALWGLWEIRFPMLSGFLADGEYDIAVPRSNWGYLYRNARPATDRDDMYRRRDGSLSGKYPSHDWPMQMLSFTKNQSSIYAAALDGTARYKTFTCKPGEEFYISDYADDMGIAGSDFPSPYAVALGVYRGDWWKSCKLYREWALKQFWTSKGPLSERESTPDIVKNVGLWAISGWEFGKSTDESPAAMNKPLVDAQNFTGVPMGLHWYNWHVNRFDNEYPYYPPKPGFKERVHLLKEQGILVMPYINGRLYDFDNADYGAANPYSSKDEAGAPFMEIYGTSSGRMISMCPYTKYWQDKITAVCDTLINELGVNGIYIDQIGSAAPHFCFDKSHGHPVGSGSWWVEGYQLMLKQIQEVAHSGGNDAVITTENNAEPYMNVLDANLIWIKRDEREIPMLAAVYSGYSLYFASPHALNVSDRSFVMSQGRDFLWGSQNGWMGIDLFSNPEHREKAGYMKTIGQYRIAAKKFLTYGELVGELRPLNEIDTITENWPTHQGRDKDATIPGIMGTIWKAEDGHLGIFIANFMDTPGSISYRIDPAEFGLAPDGNRDYVITDIKPDGNKELGVHYAGPVVRKEQLSAQEIKVIEIGVRK